MGTFEDGQRLSLFFYAKVHEGYPSRNNEKPLAMVVKVSCKGKQLQWRIKIDRCFAKESSTKVTLREPTKRWWDPF